MKYTNPADRLCGGFAAPTISHLISPEYHAERLPLEAILQGSALFESPKNSKQLLKTAKHFANKSWEREEAPTSDRAEQILDQLDSPQLRKQLPAVARTAIDCILREEYVRVYITLPHRPELQAVNRVCDAYATLLNRIIDDLPEAAQDRIHHTLMRERYAPDQMEYFGLDEIVNMPDGWMLFNGHTAGRNPSRSVRSFYEELPFDKALAEDELYASAVTKAATRSLRSLFWESDPINWANSGIINVTARNQSGTPKHTHYFAEPVTRTHLLQSAVEYDRTLHFEEWIPAKVLVDAVKDLKKMLIRKSNTTNYIPNLRDKFNNLTDTKVLQGICNHKDTQQLRYDGNWGCLVVHPDRPNRYLPVMTPADIETLPCVAKAVTNLEESYDEATVMALIRLLRAVDGNYTAEDILDYFRRFSWFSKEEESLKTLLSRRRMHNIVGCDHQSDPIIGNCIGQDKCPYRMGGSLPLSQNAKLAFHRGQRKNKP